MSKQCKQQFRVGLVGAGHISEFHLRALGRIAGVTVVGLTDFDGARAREVQRRWKLPAVFPSLEAICAEGLDVVHVLTPPASHAEVTLAALQAGCHVYVEKPLATSVEDCDRIARAAAETGRSVCVGHSLLRDPCFARAIKIVRDGAIGDPVAVDYFRSQIDPPYRDGPLPVAYRDGGYPFRDLGIHALYLIESLLGAIQDVTDRFWSTGCQEPLHFDEWRVLAKCERGTAQVHLSWNLRPLQSLLVVQGTKGVVRADAFGMTTTVNRTGRLPEHAARVVRAVSEGRQLATQSVGGAIRFVTGRVRQYHGLQTLVAEFYESLRAGRPAPVCPEEARSVVAWTETVARRADAAKLRFARSFPAKLSHPVLVTGGTGFIGRHLVQRLLDDGQRLRLLVRQSPPDYLRDDPRVELVYGDLGDPTVVDRACKGASTIYHLGAAMRGNAHDFDRATVVGTRNVVDSALNHRASRFIYMSSLSVLHALARQSMPKITETWPLEPFPDRRGNYSRTKLLAEQYVREAAQSGGLPAVILRPGEVVGPGAPLITSGIAQRRSNRLVVIGNGMLRVPMVGVDDLVDAIVLAARSEIRDGSVFHLVDERSPTQNEVIREFLASTSEPLKVKHVPRLLVYGLALTAQVCFGALRRRAPVTVYQVRSALARRDFDCSEAAKRLGWRPRLGIPSALRAAVTGSSAAASEMEVSRGANADRLETAAATLAE